jgi:hypothetical protein
MADELQEIWLPVIGRALALLCVNQVEEKMPERVDSVVKKVKFLEGIGLPRADAAQAIGSTAESVRVMNGKGGRKSNGEKKRRR